MGNLTIDQILADKRQDENPDLYGIEKKASSQPSSPYSYKEVAEMASFLKEASVPKNNGGVSFNEKLASALILQDHIASIVKEAEGCDDSGDKKSEKKEGKTEEKTASTKVASFIVQAHESGHSPEEIFGFIEKQASLGGGFMQGLKRLTTGNVGKALGGAGIIGGSAYAGKEYGEDVTEEKAKKLLPAIFNAGRMRQKAIDQQQMNLVAKKSFEMGAQRTNAAWKQRLQERFGNKG